LQSKWIAQHKNHSRALLLHGAAYLLLSTLLLLPYLNLPLIAILLGLTAFHLLVDAGKGYLAHRWNKLAWLWLFLDQIVHLFSIALAVYLFSKADRNFLVQTIVNLDVQRLVQYIILLILNLFAGLHVVDIISREYRPDNTDGHRSHALIGIFERLLITLSVLIGRFEIIGFMIAAKSIIRLPDANAQDQKDEAKAHQMINYYLIGTFVSYSWAIGWTVLFKWFV
jgi:hypothetical protein